MKLELLRAGTCPSCGAPITFVSNAAAAQVCAHCKFVVVRTDRELHTAGRVADLVPIASPLANGVTGKIDGRMFRVAGRMQYDRAGAPGAPWQEFYLELDGGASWAWLAHAQGNWYFMSLYEQPLVLPTLEQAAPGVSMRLPNGDMFTIAERSQRRPISAEGELPFPFQPGAIEAYADMSGPNGAFGTLDYSSGPTQPPQVYFGRQLDPRAIVVDGGAAALAAEPPKTQLAALKCPGCGGDLPLADPGKSERVVCRYCGMQSDVNQGALVALKKLPLPTTQPDIPLGARGQLRGQDVTLVGFMERGTTVDDERYRWREYLLYSGGMPGFVFLLEEDGRWEYIMPIGLGDLDRSQQERRLYKGRAFAWTQTVTAEVESVVGEFYWKVEVGEAVRASEWKSALEKISEEEGAGEINCSHSTPIRFPELRRAFNLAATASPAAAASEGAGLKHHLFWLGVLALWLVVSMIGCGRAQMKVVLDTPITFALPSAAKTADAKKLARFFPDGGIKTSDLRFGAVTSTPAIGPTEKVLEDLKPRVARCFSDEVTGSFTVVATLGTTGLAKNVDSKDVVGLPSGGVSCARIAFIGPVFPGVPKSGATITVPVALGAPPSPTPTPTPPPAEPDTAIFTEPFEIPADGRNLHLTLDAQNLQNNWIGLDVALVHDASGTVWEDTVELSYYSGVEDGESWSEGSRDHSLWYSRVPAGKYVLRLDPAFDPAHPTNGPIHVKVTSDDPPGGYVLGTFVVLLSLYMLGTFSRRAKRVADARKAQMKGAQTA